MSTHPHGDLYGDWRKNEAGIVKLQQEIEDEQVRHIELSQYVEGHPHFDRLMQQVAECQRFWPSEGTSNV